MGRILVPPLLTGIRSLCRRSLLASIEKMVSSLNDFQFSMVKRTSMLIWEKTSRLKERMIPQLQDSCRYQRESRHESTHIGTLFWRLAWAVDFGCCKSMDYEIVTQQQCQVRIFGLGWLISFLLRRPLIRSLGEQAQGTFAFWCSISRHWCRREPRERLLRHLGQISRQLLALV